MQSSVAKVQKGAGSVVTFGFPLLILDQAFKLHVRRLVVQDVVNSSQCSLVEPQGIRLD